MVEISWLKYPVTETGLDNIVDSEVIEAESKLLNDDSPGEEDTRWFLETVDEDTSVCLCETSGDTYNARLDTTVTKVEVVMLAEAFGV